MTEKRKTTFAKNLKDRDRIKEGDSGINRETEKKRQSERQREIGRKTESER